MLPSQVDCVSVSWEQTATFELGNDTWKPDFPTLNLKRQIYCNWLDVSCINICGPKFIGWLERAPQKGSLSERLQINEPLIEWNGVWFSLGWGGGGGVLW